MITNLAIVRNMHIGHDPVVITNPSNSLILRSTRMNGCELPNRISVTNDELGRLTAVFHVLRFATDGRKVTDMRPEKRVYRVQQNPMTEAAIDPGFTRDLYVSLGEPTTNGAWIVRVYVKPFIDWIWGGCLIMALGGLLAVTDRRYRSKVRRDQTEATLGGAGASA